MNADRQGLGVQETSNDRYRKDLLELLQTGLGAVEGRQCVKNYLLKHPVAAEKTGLLAIGKAASSMTLGVLDVLADQLHSGLLITKYAYLATQLNHITGLQCIESAHPVPDESCLQAGQALLDYLQHLPTGLPLIVLISGGASALVEVLPETVGIADLQQTNQWLLASGLPIDQMNIVRKAISCIKAGRLAHHLGQRQVIHLLLSDVPDNDPAVIGSGLLVPDDSNAVLPQSLPAWLQTLVTANLCQADRTDPIFRQIETVIIADNRQACVAIQRGAEAQGYRASINNTPLSGDAVKMAKQIAKELASAEPGLMIWGGETTVQLPESPGRGGRNQHLALALAEEIQGDERYHILVTATDGSDGPTDDAGALIDGQTIRRGEQEGLSASQCLQLADAGRFLELSGDLINTGATGTNVMDLVIAIKH